MTAARDFKRPFLFFFSNPKYAGDTCRVVLVKYLDEAVDICKSILFSLVELFTPPERPDEGGEVCVRFTPHNVP
jgi:hypothetical protein